MKINKPLETAELITLFREHTGCGMQHGKCPCNSCFHAIDADFRHITWLILLGLRGDYDGQWVLDKIKTALDKEAGEQLPAPPEEIRIEGGEA